MESILTSIKKLLGPEEDYTHFDMDIIMCINSAFMTLNQLGIGPEEGFAISDKTSTWSDFIGTTKLLESVKTYVFLKVKLMFDPPQMGYLVEAIKGQISEIEWRLELQANIHGIAPTPEPPVPSKNDYEELINKPKIDGVTLQGNKRHKDLGFDEITNSQISSMFT